MPETKIAYRVGWESTMAPGVLVTCECQSQEALIEVVGSLTHPDVHMIGKIVIEPHAVL